MADRYFELEKNSFSRYLGRGLCFLAELSHPAWDETFYICNNTAPVIINNITYEPFPFDIILPSQTEQQGTQIVLSNIQNFAANLIRSTVKSNINIKLHLYICNIETEIAQKFDKGEFEIFNPQITNEMVQANINLRHSFDINCGSIRYNRQLFPNLFL